MQAGHECLAQRPLLEAMQTCREPSWQHPMKETRRVWFRVSRLLLPPPIEGSSGCTLKGACACIRGMDKHNPSPSSWKGSWAI
jgi:hypothetical protein